MPLDNRSARVCEADLSLAELPTRVLSVVMPSGRASRDRCGRVGWVPLDGVVRRVPEEQHFDDGGRRAELLGRASSTVGTRCPRIEGVPDVRDVRAKGADSQPRIWLGTVREYLPARRNRDAPGHFIGDEESSRAGNIRSRAAADQDGEDRKNGSGARHHTNRYTGDIQNVPRPIFLGRPFLHKEPSRRIETVAGVAWVLGPMAPPPRLWLNRPRSGEPRGCPTRWRRR